MQRLLGVILAALLFFACPAWAQKESTFPRATSVLPTDLVMLVRPGNTQPNVMAPVSMLPGGGAGSCCVIHGATSGTITLAAPAVAGTHTITFPAQSFDLSATGGTNQVLQQSAAGGPITVGQLAASQLSNGVTGSGAVVLAVSPALTGVPLAPTAAPGTNTTQIATTAFVQAAVGASGSITLGSTNIPLNTTATTIAGLTLASPTFTGTVAGAGTIPNAVLANSSVTVNTHTVALGASTTINFADLGGTLALSQIANVTGRTILGRSVVGSGAVTAAYSPSGDQTVVVTLSGTPLNGECANFSVSGAVINITTAGAACSSGGGGGSVTSVGLTVPGSSIFGVTGSPITTAGSLGLTTTGTSGGIPYFSSGTALSSSALLAANRLVVGGGAATAPVTIASLGTTTTVLHGNAAGLPSFGSVAPADTTGTTGSGTTFVLATGPTITAATLAGPTTTTGQFKTTGATTGIAWFDGYEDVNAAGIYTEWGMPTWATAVSSKSYNINGGGNIFQFASALTSTGSMNSTALYGSARSKSANSGVWAINTTATCDTAGGSCVSYEADIASTVPGAANAIGILLSTSQLGCVPVPGLTCHPGAANQVNTNVDPADISNYLSHSLNRDWIPSFNNGMLFASAQLVVGGITYNTPAVTGVLIQACCYNSNIVSGTILPSVGFIDVTTATFSSYEWNSSNALIGPTINNAANKVQLVGAVAGLRPKIQTTGEANRGMTIAGTGTGFVDIGNIGTQAGVCIGPVASGSAPVLTSCGGESGGTDGGLVINTASGLPVLFPVPLGFPHSTVAGWGTCDGSKTYQRVMVSDGSGTGFRNTQPGGGSTILPIYCDGGGAWRNGSNQWYCADVNHRRIADNDNDHEDCRTAHNRRLAA